MPDIDFTSLGKTPISSDNPVGIDITYEPDFEWIQEETAKLAKAILVKPGSDDEELEKGKPRFAYQPVDWERIIDIGCRLLREQSKDLRVASWLAIGLMETKGVTGLADGVDVFHQLLQEYFDKAYPTRTAGRVASILNLRDTVMRRLDGDRSTKQLPVSAEDVTSLARLAELVARLNEFLKKQMADSPVSLNLLESIVDNRLVTARSLAETASKAAEEQAKPAAREVPQQQTSTQPQPSAPASAEQKPDGGTQTPAVSSYDFSRPADKGRYFGDVQKTASRLHGHALEKSLSDPVPYRWVRVAYWLPLGFTSDRTEVPMPGPNETLRESLDALWRGGEWIDLLKASEKQFASYWFWLDLQRYSMDALESLGSDYDFVRKAIKSEIIFLLHRLPFFVNMKSQDGVPVATPETKDWLTELASQEPSGVATQPETGAAAISQSSLKEPLSLVIDQAGSVPANLEKARECLRSSRSEKDRFQVQLKLAEYLLNRKEVILAHNYLVQLERLMKKHELELWDPELAVQSLILLHKSTLRMGKVRKNEKQDFVEKSRVIASRIAVLDPVAAASIVRE